MDCGYSLWILVRTGYSKGLQPHLRVARPLVLKLCLDILVVIASPRRGCGNPLFPVLYEIASVTSFLTLMT